MALLNLLLILIIYYTLFNVLRKKVGVSEREMDVMLGGYSLVKFIEVLIIIILSVFTGTFSAIIGASLINLVISGALAYYFFKQAGYNLLDLFK